MKIKAFLFIIQMLVGFVIYAQQLPLGACGIVCTYDASGNRLKRLYFCNNGGVYPARVSQEAAKTTEEFQSVEALYPNPTTGLFFVTFSKELINAKVFLTDLNGKIVLQFAGNGNKLKFDLSAAPAGIYIVRIEDNGLIITKKVVKL
ncbi:T9SS type A sorting domain-containing protein [Niastella caeni]|uniref:T9SS type A sorting domain-containing protein n=1 Tax=Niastella caeni TaxID=2569763 RepID=A0A4S8HIF2_9BACT|nr:T9SS type A sorting domain-containing protein [Niastella caeni]THU34990.1 T9SS type A sorting domain-containing protein [Niastella caeni]